MNGEIVDGIYWVNDARDGEIVDGMYWVINGKDNSRYPSKLSPFPKQSP